MPQAKTISVTLTVQVDGDASETVTVTTQTPMMVADRAEYALAVDALTAQLVRRVLNFWPMAGKTK